MIPTQSFRSVVPLVIGLAVGGLGVGLFQHSTPGEAGSPEKQIQHLESELQQARTRIAALEETRPRSSRTPAQTAYDRGRAIAQRLREGIPVSSDDLFRAAQPLLRDMAPLFERIADQEFKQRADSLIGELARKYDLKPRQQETLQQWFSEKSRTDRKKWNDLISSDDTTYIQWVKSMRNDRTDEGLDPVMEELLKGPQLEAFKAERLEERSQRVQQYADRQVQRINNLVQLDPAQTDRLFGIMAQSSPDYDSSIRLEGVTGEIAPANLHPRDALKSVLRPDQLAEYEADRQRRLMEASRKMNELGVELPADWDEFEFGP
jgi:hypothetical protein